MKKLFVTLFSALMVSSAFAAGPAAPCYELRIYYAPPGKIDALNARFREHTLKIFEKHGMTNIGYWMQIGQQQDRLTYLLSYPSRAAARESWKKFFADPEWQAVVRATEANGSLVARVDSTYLIPTDYSPQIKPQKEEPPRLFELRTYKATKGKLAELNARFRNHTKALFDKHGISQFGYWTPTDKGLMFEDTLIYIVAHKNREAADKAWNAFRADPVWIEAKKASEVNGSLTAKVESVYMTPTDYSPTK